VRSLVGQACFRQTTGLLMDEPEQATLSVTLWMRQEQGLELATGLGFVTTRLGRSRLALDVCGKTHADVPLRARQTILISATTLL